MRPKALDRALPMPVIRAFVWFGTFAFFSTAVMIIFLLAAHFQPLKAEQADHKVCVNRATFDQALGGTRHPYMLTFPKNLSRDFIIAWNAGIRGFSVPVTTDTVSLYEDENDMYRVAFFKGNCLVEAVDVPGESFWAIIKMASGPGRWKI